MYKLRDWIDLERIHWFYLSQNPAAIHLLEQHPEKIDWTYLSQNQEAISLLEKYQKKNRLELFISISSNNLLSRSNTLGLFI